MLPRTISQEQFDAIKQMLPSINNFAMEIQGNMYFENGFLKSDNLKNVRPSDISVEEFMNIVSGSCKVENANKIR